MLCIKVVVQSRHWQGDWFTQCWRTFMPSSPTCSRMVHAGEGHSQLLVGQVLNTLKLPALAIPELFEADDTF